MMRLTESARGVLVIAATPFTPAGALDLASLDRGCARRRDALLESGRLTPPAGSGRYLARTGPLPPR